MTMIGQQVADQIREAKNDRVRTMRKGGHDLCPFVRLWRAGHDLVTIEVPVVDRDVALDAVMLAVPGYGADALVFVSDARISYSPTNPVTGEAWGPGSMQAWADAGNDEGITECLLVDEKHRSGEWATWAMPYVVDVEHRTITWREELTFASGDGESRAGGFVADVISDAFGLPDFLERTLAKEAPKLDPDDMPAPELLRVHTDAGITAALVSRGYLVTYRGESEEEGRMANQIVKEWLQRQKAAAILREAEQRVN